MSSESADAGRPPSSQPPDDTVLQGLIEQYLQELADGQQPDQSAYLAAHPDLADELRGVFRTLDFVEATSQALRAPVLQGGSRLGDFQIRREVARGGMGVVYEALQIPLNRRVALKVLPAGALLSRTAPERFMREAQAAAQLHHTNIVPVYAIGQEQGIHYYAMQYIEGHSLAELVRDQRQQSRPADRAHCARVARWGQQIADALDYAHSQGTIHRDIKPSNLLLDAHDNVWVTDFGLARANAYTTITLSGDVVGTARYMSPEQARGGRGGVDARSDIYALGATLYELLALRPAYDGESRDDVLTQITFTSPPPLRQLSRAVPRDLETIVTKCMEKEPARRYARARDVAEDCRRFTAGEPIRARRTSVLVKAGRFVRRHRLHVTGALVALVLAAAVLCLTISLRHTQGQRCVDDALNAMLFERDARRATQLLDKAQSLGIDSADYYLCRGLSALLFSQPHLSFVPLNEALRRDPDHVEATVALGLAHSVIGDATQAEQFLGRFGSTQLKTALAWLLRGLALSYAGGDAPIEAFNQAVTLRPDFIPAIEERAIYRSNRLLIEGTRDELEPMLYDFDAWVVFRPSSARAYSSRAVGRLAAAAFAAHRPELRARADEWLDGSRRDLTQAFALRPPDDVGPYMRRMAYFDYVNDFRSLADSCADAIAIDQAATGRLHPGFVHYRVLALHALGDLPTALREAEAACAEPVVFWGLVLQRALLLADLGRLPEARQLVESSLKDLSGPDVKTIFVVWLELLDDHAAARDALVAFGGASPSPSPASGPVRLAEYASFRYLADGLDAPAWRALVGEHPGRQCEANFAIGVHELAAGRRDAARSALQACLDTGVYPYMQYRLAQILVARLDHDPTWPAWLDR